MEFGKYHHLVPREREANLAFRREMVRLGCSDPERGHDLWVMCARDPLFYIDTFVYTYNPRIPDPKVQPWISYDFQVDAFREIFACLSNEDLVVEKSRDMGASWMFLTAFQWAWLFREMQSFLLVSRNEDYVDKPGNPKSLFWKLDFINDRLPGFLKPRIERTKLRLSNRDNGSMMDGESTTGDVGRGDRRTAILMDEFAAFENNDGYKALSSTRDTSDCRFFNSTPQGTGNAFFDVVNSKIRKLRLHWSVHPIKNADLEIDEDGRPTSPWYRQQCDRAVHAREIAQELDIDFSASDVQYFDGQVLDGIQRQHVRPPTHTGELEYLGDSLEPWGFHQSAKGRMRLWIPIVSGDKPTPQRYIIGSDIATGTGASNSSLCIVSARTGEQVAEWTSPHIRPEEFARLSVAVCNWFKDENGRPALLVPEANGPGRPYIATVIETGFRNIYMREAHGKVTRHTTDQPGWWSTKDKKNELFAEYRDALKNGSFIPRSYEQIAECRDYVFTKTGAVAHSASQSDIDPSGAKENHGDRPTAAALAVKMLKRAPREMSRPQNIPLGSMAYRRFMRKKREREALAY